MPGLNEAGGVNPRATSLLNPHRSSLGADACSLGRGGIGPPGAACKTRYTQVLLFRHGTSRVLDTHEQRPVHPHMSSTRPLPTSPQQYRYTAFAAPTIRHNHLWVTPQLCLTPANNRSALPTA